MGLHDVLQELLDIAQPVLEHVDLVVVRAPDVAPQFVSHELHLVSQIRLPLSHGCLEFIDVQLSADAVAADQVGNVLDVFFDCGTRELG